MPPTGFYKIRFDIFERDNFKCIYCGRSSIEHGVVLEVDHLNPRRGIKANWDNVRLDDLVTACKDCNVGKRDRVLSLPILTRIKEKITSDK